MIARTKGLLRFLSRTCERVPVLRTLGVSQVIGRPQSIESSKYRA